MLRSFGFALVAALSLMATATSARPLTARDLNAIERVSDPRVSPDGRYVVYQLRSTDWEANRGRNALWLVDLQATDNSPRRLQISEGGASSPRWSSDSRFIYFLSSRAQGRTQVFRTEPDGRSIAQLTNLPLDVGSFRVSPDGQRLVVSLAVFPDCPDPSCTAARLTADAADGRSGQVYDRTFVRHWDEWANGTRNHLHALEIDPGGAVTTARDLTPGFDGDAPSRPFGDDAEYAFTPDGRALVFSARMAGRTEPWSTNFDLFRVQFDRPGAPENLTAANPAWDTGPVFSPDGRFMAYRAMRRPGFEADRFAIMLRDLSSGATREVAPRWDRSADSLQWSADGSTLYALAQDTGQTLVFAIDVASGRADALTRPGHVGGFDMSSAGLVYTHDTLSGPAELWLNPAPGTRPTQVMRGRPPAMTRTVTPSAQLTQHNASLTSTLDLGEAEQFRFRGWNNETVHGYLVRPANFDPSRRYPVAFLIHGGPQGSFGNNWHYRWNAQTYAARGYAVVMIDFHGSTGYGQHFTDAISNHWGDRPLEDLQKGWAHALRQYPFLDGDRACALGGSYGGYMVNWMAGRWNEPWRCFVSHAGILDTRAMGYETEELWFTEWENGGATPWQRPENYERSNPVRHVGQWRRPTLVIHGANDFRVPLTQGLGVFNALQRQNVPSEFLYFPDENHWILKPNNNVQWHDTVIAWLDRWTAEGPPVR